MQEAPAPFPHPKPFRPIPGWTPPRLAVVIITDGWTRSTFDRLYQNGALPELADWLNGRGRLFRNVISVIPSVSIASHTTLLTGVPARIHGIPIHAWLEEATSRVRNYQTSGFRRINPDLPSALPTVFDFYEHSVAHQVLVSRGASTVERILSQSTKRLLANLVSGIRRIPRGVHVCWLPGGDSAAHLHGPDSEQVAAEMRQTSAGVGDVLQEIDKLGLADDAVVVLVPDHGLRESSMVTSLRSLRTVLGKDGPDWHLRVNPLVSMRSFPGSDFVALTNGGSSLYVYPPRQITGRALAELADTMAHSGHFDMVVARISPWLHRVSSVTGTSQIRVTPSPSVAGYEVLSGSDPLGLPARSSRVSLDEPVLSHYPDFIPQYLDSIVPGRSPGILAFSRPGRFFAMGPRPAWRLGFHKGSHGGPLHDEVVVAAIVQTPFAGLRPALAPIRSRDLLRLCGVMPGLQEFQRPETMELT